MKNTPEIRFEGFHDEWEEKAISEIATVVGGGTPSTSKPEYWNGNINWYTPKEIQDNIFASKSERKITELGLNNSSAKMLPVNTLLFTSRATIGEMAILRTPGSTNQGFQSLILNDTCEPYFIYSLKEDIKTRAINKASGSTFLEISKNNVEKLNVNVPNKNEQKKLAKLFFEMDKLLCLKDKEIEKLKFYKKSMLENMFPRKGEKVPKIRFEGFDKNWVKTSISKSCDFYDNLRIPVKESNRMKGDIPYYGANGILDWVKGYTHKGEFVLIAEDGASNLNKYPIHYLKGHAWINNHAHVVSGKPNFLDNKFLYNSLKLVDYNDFLSGTSRYKLNSSQLKRINILMPSLEEQKLIGNFFYNLDKHIELKKDELEKLKEFKVALLDKMFV